MFVGAASAAGSVLNPQYYTLQGTETGARTVRSVTYDAETRTAYLSFGPLLPDDFTLTIGARADQPERPAARCQLPDRIRSVRRHLGAGRPGVQQYPARPPDRHDHVRSHRHQPHRRSDLAAGAADDRPDRRFHRGAGQRCRAERRRPLADRSRRLAAAERHPRGRAIDHGAHGLDRDRRQPAPLVRDRHRRRNAAQHGAGLYQPAGAGRQGRRGLFLPGHRDRR